MKKLDKISRSLLLTILILTGLGTYAQTPTYSCVATNDTLWTSKIFQFDIYIYRTGTTDFYLNNYQLSFLIDSTAKILNGGTLTPSYVSGTSQLPAAFVPLGANILAIGPIKIFRADGTYSTSNGTLIPASGLRIGTFQITNSVNFGQSPMGLEWYNATPGNTDVIAIVPPDTTGTAQPITDMTFHSANFVNPILNLPDTVFNMTGGGNYCAGGGADVGISGSELGVLYRLVFNGVPVGWWIPGTGSALSFGPQTAGTYTCIAYRDNTYITANMNGSVICTIGSVTPVITGNNSVCAGAQGVVYSTAAGKTNYQWTITGGTIISGAGTNSITVNWGSTQPASIGVTYTDISCNSLPANYPVSFSGTLSTDPISISALANPICPGSSTVLTVTGGILGTGAEWTWYAGTCGGTILGIGTSITVTPGVNTTYYVRGVGTCNTTGCVSLLVTVGANLPAGVLISSSPSGLICHSTNVTFTATPTNGGPAPSYQWQLNGSNIGTNNSIFTTSAFNPGSNLILVTMTSNDPCATGSPVTSKADTVIVFNNTTAHINISNSPAGPVCAGTNVTFTAAISGGGTSPAYQWMVNGSNVGTNSSTYTTSTLNNGDSVKCVLTSNALCVVNSPVTAIGIKMDVNQSMPTSVAISANPAGAICPVTNVTFTATATNGGTPTYQWTLNGSNVGTNSSTYTNNSWANNDVVACIMTSSLSCATNSPATCNMTMTVNPTVNASVAISSNPPPSQVCSGNNVIFTVSPTYGGTSPSYQWKINGADAGPNSSTFTTSSLANNDLVTCVMTSNDPCVTVNSVASNTLTMTVTTSVPVSVTIAPIPLGAICAGTTVTYTATGINAGTLPVYQWQIGGTNVGTNSSVYTNNAFNNGDIVTCILTSSISCTTGSPYTSNPVTMTVNPVPSVNLGNDTTLCSNQYIILNAGDGYSQYLWNNGGTSQLLQLDTSVIHGLGTITSIVTVTNVSQCSASDTIKVTFTSCIGVEEFSNNTGIRCYPNPTKGIVNISIEGLAQKAIELTVVNVYSQLLYSEKITNIPVNFIKPLDLGIYPKGVYYLKLIAGDKIYGCKIIVD